MKYYGFKKEQKLNQRADKQTFTKIKAANIKPYLKWSALEKYRLMKVFTKKMCSHREYKDTVLPW